MVYYKHVNLIGPVLIHGLSPVKQRFLLNFFLEVIIEALKTMQIQQ